ncbi:DUF4271 domain-containing protein [Oscillatoria amoena NRMC-F 0135]|nr:DUF4271 domain-containing protein [Oscillatoria amoena NRMC-F 0135]
MFFFLFALSVPAQPSRIVKKNLEAEWLIYSDQQFVPYSGEPEATIYFYVDLQKFAGDYLLLGSSKAFAVFMEGKLVLDEVAHVNLSIDSLAEVFASRKILVAIHQEPSVKNDLTTQLISSLIIPAGPENDIVKFEETGFRNFMIAAVVLLVFYVLLIFRFNPNLTSDYISLRTLFSLRESDDHPMFNRIGSTTNMLAYGLVALLTALLLIQTPFEISDFRMDSPNGFSGWGLHWLAIGLLVLALLFVKALILFIFCALFNMRELTGFHYFNFVRFLLFTMGVLLILVVIQVFSTGTLHPNHPSMAGVVHYVLLGWIVLLYLKLANKTRHTPIHLFLYICATEIIPFLIIIKVYK